MKQLLDFLPLLVFFGVYKFYGIIAATGAIIVASAIQLTLMYTLYKKVEKMHLFTFAILLVFGGATVFFQNDAFIKWKVTIVYSLFCAILIGGNLMGKPVMKAMLGKEMKLPTPIWMKVGYAWSGFFAACAAANVYVAFSLPQETWVNFKVFGLTGLTLTFTVLTFVYLFKHLPKEQK
ncbi:septation protein A [Ferrimonas lipolytica]|uniref:Inner membrane-spanning protein YciB n=1 Tax=Ferrimonas lipolytica TaxID=2724191 RepID=A0A6H1UCD2_9GAMM|nr:septation protein A [Ferrimonas lipolytica]QIZ75866.1 septation protein A [Ferrimonas lipolytica]